MAADRLAIIKVAVVSPSGDFAGAPSFGAMSGRAVSGPPVIARVRSDRARSDRGVLVGTRSGREEPVGVSGREEPVGEVEVGTVSGGEGPVGTVSGREEPVGEVAIGEVAMGEVTIGLVSVGEISRCWPTASVSSGDPSPLARLIGAMVRR